jgi:hypothetical protein
MIASTMYLKTAGSVDVVLLDTTLDGAGLYPTNPPAGALKRPPDDEEHVEAQSVNGRCQVLGRS